MRVLSRHFKRSLSKNEWEHTIDIDEEKTADIVITDGDYYAVINTKLITSYIIKDAEFYSGFFNFSTDEMEAFLMKHGKQPKDSMGWSLNLDAKEGVLEENETVTIAGKASWRKPSDFKFKIPADKVLYLDALNEEGIFITDDPYIS